MARKYWMNMDNIIYDDKIVKLYKTIVIAILWAKSVDYKTLIFGKEYQCKNNKRYEIIPEESDVTSNLTSPYTPRKIDIEYECVYVKTEKEKEETEIQYGERIAQLGYQLESQIPDKEAIKNFNKD